MAARVEQLERLMSGPARAGQPDFLPRKVQEIDSKVSFASTWNALLAYQAEHRRKLDDLVARVAVGHVVRVLFLVAYPGKFGFETIYDHMRANPLFDPHLVIVHAFDRSGDADTRARAQAEARESYALFRARGYSVDLGFTESGRAIDLSEWAPDIVFFNNPNLYQHSSFDNHRISFQYLSCYVSYGMYLVQDPEYQFNYFPVNSAWINFVDLPFTFREHVRPPARFHGLNTVLSGYPKLDRYLVADPDHPLPAKLDNGSPIVIVAPHWSVKVTGIAANMATFHLYHETFADLRRSHPGINFVFKPHPDLHLRLGQGVPGAPTLEEYEAYLAEWDSAENGMVITEGEYIELFRRSACLITDSGSFIGEYLPSGSPCIYLLNPDRPDPLRGYNELGRRVLDTFYTCLTERELLERFGQVVVRGNDPKAEARTALLGEEFVNLGTAGRFIVEELERRIRSGGPRALG